MRWLPILALCGCAHGFDVGKVVQGIDRAERAIAAARAACQEDPSLPGCDRLGSADRVENYLEAAKAVLGESAPQ